MAGITYTNQRTGEKLDYLSALKLALGRDPVVVKGPGIVYTDKRTGKALDYSSALQAASGGGVGKSQPTGTKTGIDTSSTGTGSPSAAAGDLERAYQDAQEFQLRLSIMKLRHDMIMAALRLIGQAFA